MTYVPFTLSNLYLGFARGEGLLRDEATHLCLEYEIKDTVVGAMKSGVSHIRIPWTDLASVVHEKSWWGSRWLGSKIVIQTNRLEVLRDIPSAVHGRIELQIANKDQDAASRLVANLPALQEKSLQPFRP